MIESSSLRLIRLDPDVARGDFTCGDADLDEYYKRDSIKGAEELLSVSYAAVDSGGKTAAFFSLSNDSITRESVPTKSAFKRLVKSIPFEKRYASMPAAKIGRFGVDRSFHSHGLGGNTLTFIKYWLANDNKTGCRFLAYNTDKVIDFYRKNGFRFISRHDEGEDTRIMYLDLIEFKR